MWNIIIFKTNIWLQLIPHTVLTWYSNKKIYILHSSCGKTKTLFKKHNSDFGHFGNRAKNIFFFNLLSWHSNQNCSIDHNLQIGSERNFNTHLKWKQKITCTRNPTRKKQKITCTRNPTRRQTFLNRAQHVSALVKIADLQAHVVSWMRRVVSLQISYFRRATHIGQSIVSQACETRRRFTVQQQSADSTAYQRRNVHEELHAVPTIGACE